MSREDIIAVGLRVLAVYFVVQAVGFLTMGSVPLVDGNGSHSMAKDVLVPAVLFAFAATALWLFPLSIARKLLPVARDSGSPLAIADPRLQVLALTVLGVWLVASATAHLAYWVALRHFLSGLDDYAREFSPEQKAAVAMRIADLAIGIGLALGARGLLGLVERLRGRGPAPGTTTGDNPASSSTDAPP